MKNSAIILITLMILNACSTQPVPNDKQYLGQIPPGNQPKVFKLSVSPGTFAAERIAISKDGSEIYYSEIKSYYPVTGAKLKYYKYVNNVWTGPFILFNDYFAPAFSNSEDTLYFERGHFTYYSVRAGSKWLDPRIWGSKLDSAHYLQVTRNKNYFASARSGSSIGLSDWSRIIFIGNDTCTISLGFPINNVGENQDFYIAKDESYMITCPGGPVGISYPYCEDRWLNSRPLNKKINFGISNWGVYVTTDQKYLFYTTGTKIDYSDVNVYWVSLDNIIDSMRYTNIPPYVRNIPKPCIAYVGRKFSYTISENVVCDEDGNSITYEALQLDGNPLPAWLTFDPGTRTLSGTPPEVSDIILRINAYDDNKSVTAFRFIISVKDK